MKKGDVVLVPFPFTDLTGTKTRPAVVLIADSLDVTLAFVTTRVGWETPNDLLLSPSETNGISKVSLVRTSKLATIDAKLVFGKLGELSTSERLALDQKLVAAFQLNSGSVSIP